MNHNLKDPLLYDRVFRPGRGVPILLSVIFGIAFGLTLFLVLSGRATKQIQIWFPVIFGLFFVVCLFLIWFLPKMLWVGINEEGVYVRKYGMVFWDEIKGFQVTKVVVNGATQKMLYIALHNPDAFFARHPKSWIGRKSCKNSVIIPDGMIGVKLEEMIEILQEYLQRFTRST